jgi:hypothetical protein
MLDSSNLSEFDTATIMLSVSTSDPELTRIEAALTRGRQSAEGRIRLAIFSASMQQVRSSGAVPSIASVSAAIITGLEGPSLNDAATVSAMFFLLATLLPHLSDVVLRGHADAVSHRVTQALSKHPDVVSVLRWACPVLSRLLLCQVGASLSSITHLSHLLCSPVQPGEALTWRPLSASCSRMPYTRNQRPVTQLPPPLLAFFWMHVLQPESLYLNKQVPSQQAY